MAKRANTKDRKIPRAKVIHWLESMVGKILAPLTTLAPNNVGTPKKNENSAADF